MYKCKTCGKEYENRYAFLGHCSSHSRGTSYKEKRKNEIKISEKTKTKNYNKIHGYKCPYCDLTFTNSQSYGGHVKNCKFNPKLITQMEETQIEWNKKLLEADFNTLKYERLKKRILLEQDNKCNKCGLDTWLGKQITLELEHKDGEHTNNVRENLECLCPNCHSQTPTWKGKNKKTNKNKITDTTLINSLLNSTSIRQALLTVGLAAKGGNYVRCKRLMIENKIIL